MSKHRGVTIFLLVFITITFAGCVTLTEYQTSEMLKIKGGMDRAKALNVFSNIFMGTNDASGFCEVSAGPRSGNGCERANCYGYDRTLEGAPSVNNAGISFKAWKPGEYIQLNQYRKKHFIKQINFEDITKVIIYDSDLTSGILKAYLKGHFISCLKGDHVVAAEYTLSEEDLKFMPFNIIGVGVALIAISKNDIDALMASLSILAPKAKLFLRQPK